MNRELVTSFVVLKKIYEKNAFSSITLNNALQRTKNINHGLVTKLVYGVLEQDRYLEYNIAPFTKKRPKEFVMVLFKMGFYASHNLNSIPPFALVNELVEICKKEQHQLSGFVNATLKNIIKAKPILPSKQNLVEYLGIKYSYPNWLVSMLLKEQSKEFVEELLAAQLPTLTNVRVNTNVCSIKQFEDSLKQLNIAYEPSLLNNAFYVNYEQLLAHPELENYYVVIGVTSMNLVDMIHPNPNETVFDACASPGNKSLYLSQTNPTIKIVAGDLHEHRVELIKKLIAKYGVSNITPILNDATVKNAKFVNAFDTVVCDVPCSGIGVAGKKPDILLNRQEKDIKVLQTLQKQILQTSASYVKPGGQLVYSTCTILKAENEDVVQDFLQTNKEFELQKITHPNNIQAHEKDNMITYYPHLSHTEGFFVAKLIKKG